MGAKIILTQHIFVERFIFLVTQKYKKMFSRGAGQSKTINQNRRLDGRMLSNYLDLFCIFTVI